jgi:Zn-dependent protease
MFRRAVRIGRLFGVPLEVDASWIVVFLLVAAALSLSYFPAALPHATLWVDVIVGTLTSLVFFASIVAHELCHSLVARHYGIRVERITLFLFGGVSELVEEPREPHVELLMAFAGPAASLLLGLAFFAASLAAPALGVGSVVWVPVQYLAGINLLLGVFNLAPGYPMDGGRVLHAYLWWALGDRLKATAGASWAGRILALLLVGLGLLEISVIGLGGLWPVFLGLFLLRLASQAYAMQAGGLRLASVRIDQAMTRPAPVVDGSDPVSDVAADSLRRDIPAVLVVEHGSVAGVLPADRAARFALDDPRAAEVALVDPLFFVDVSDSIETALRRFASGAPALVAVDRGRAVGLVTPASVAALTVPGRPFGRRG